MITDTPLPKFAKPHRGLRGWTTGALRFGHGVRKLTAHKTRGPREPFLYWSVLWGKKEMDCNRRLRRHIWLTWKGTLSSEQRALWSDAALTVSIRNYKGNLKTPNGYQLFTWHHYFNSVTALGFPFPWEWDDMTFDLEPPDPYVLPAAPNITGLLQSTSTGFKVSTDNWPETGTETCLISVQRLSLPSGKKALSKKFTGTVAYGTGVGSAGALNVYATYPFNTLPPGGILRVGLRYRTPGASGDTGATSPTIAADANAGDSPWSDAMNICDYNDTVATCTIDGTLAQTNSNKIQATNFDWDPPIPDTSDMLGIKAEVMRQEITQGGGLHDLSVRLIKAGVEVGDNKGTQPWGNDQAFPYPYKTYGSDSDLWGETWTGADLNDPDFGLSISCHRTGEHAIDIATVTHVQLSAFYTAIPGRIPSNPTFYDWTRPA